MEDSGLPGKEMKHIIKWIAHRKAPVVLYGATIEFKRVEVARMETFDDRTEIYVYDSFTALEDRGKITLSKSTYFK